MNRFRKILCAVDFDLDCESLVDLAQRLCADSGAEIHLLHVARIPPSDQDVPVPLADNPRWEMQAKEQLRNLAGKFLNDSIKCELHVSSGVPERDIAHLANKLGADLIVMGIHGHTGLGHLISGSVAEDVMLKADCAVITLKSAKSAPQASTDPEK
ncbi:MAG: universal stress protein [Candidatus Binataceae bacterium]